MNITTIQNMIAVRAFAALTLISLLAGAFPAFVFEASAQGAGAAGGGGSARETVTICHATNSHVNPYNVQNPDQSSDVAGHDGHDGPVWYDGIDENWGDIIPPFTYFENDEEKQYPGKNWDSDGQAVWNNDCQVVIEDDPEWDLSFRKEFSGEDLDLDEDEFSFRVVGDHGVDMVLDNKESIMLEAGSYTVSEVGPLGWEPGLWTIKWSGKLCENVTGESTTITLDKDNEKFSFDQCTAENQYKPGVLKVVKEVVGTTSAPSDFSFSVNGGSEIAFDGSGINTVDVPAGNYSIVETAAAGYETTYSDECSGTITNTENKTCTITNTYDEDNGGGTDATSTVTVIKELVGTTTSPTQFSFRLNEGRSIGFEEDGSNVIEVPAGDYVIEEVSATGYTIATSSDCSGTIGTGEQRTCTITNTWSDDNGGGGQCEAEMPGWADEYQNVNQGTQKGGNTVLDGRSDADKALGPADWSAGGDDGFFSLGFGGSFEVVFDKFVPDEDGDDISIHEATNGNYPLESAMVEVSQNGTDWETLTEEARNNANEDGASVTLLDFSETGFAWIKYVRITDTTDSDLHNDEADGFDLDAVDAVKEVCDEPDGNGDNGDNGGGGNDEDTYRVEGYVWHDNNENSEWDGFQDEEATTTEEALSGWTVKITNGTDTFSTTTNANGYYNFEVPAGSWTISETVMNGWDLITPNNNTHKVTVPATTTAQTLGERVFAFFVPTVHAEVLDTFGFYNFGNNESEVVTTGGGGGRITSGGGGSSRPRCSAFTISDTGLAYSLDWETRWGSSLSIMQNGTEIFTTDDDDIVDEGNILVTSNDANFELTVSRGSREDTCTIEMNDNGGSSSTPDGEVLGEQVSVVPLGAANAGAGGAAPVQTTSFAQTLVLFLRDRFIVLGNAK